MCYLEQFGEYQKLRVGTYIIWKHNTQNSELSGLHLRNSVSVRST